MTVDIGQYFNLVTDNIDKLVIVETNDRSNCYISSINGRNFFAGFILSDTQLVQTICSVGFYPSGDTGKYIPRLEFKKVLKSNSEIRESKQNFVRISFNNSEEGHKQFWQMINFLKSFKDLVDTDNFNNFFRVVTDQEFIEYLNAKDKLQNLSNTLTKLEGVNIDSLDLLQTASVIKLLDGYREKILYFIRSKVDEKEVQRWIDEDNHVHRSKRCLIFGLEFLRHYREGGVSGNRYDLLTRIGLENTERVLIELKSPNDEVFEEDKSPTINELKVDYKLSKSLSRAIPQILEYRLHLENKLEGDPELQKTGEISRIKIAKCIIVIGFHEIDARWIANLRELRLALSSSLEIWTYSDLLNKMDATIQNLKQGYCYDPSI